MSDVDAVPTSIRRLDGADAARLARLVGAYDDLQTVLRCCERLIAALAEGGARGPANDGEGDVVVEALWTLVLLSYARCFSEEQGEAAGAAPLTELDVGEGAEGSHTRWHQVLLHLRDVHVSPTINPRETYTVGLAQNAVGVVDGVAVTSVHGPTVDVGAVRQVGTMVLPLCEVLDRRIGELQKEILSVARETPAAELESLERVDIVG